MVFIKKINIKKVGTTDQVAKWNVGVFAKLRLRKYQMRNMDIEINKLRSLRKKIQKHH